MKLGPPTLIRRHCLLAVDSILLYIIVVHSRLVITRLLVANKVA